MQISRRILIVSFISLCFAGLALLKLAAAQVSVPVEPPPSLPKVISRHITLDVIVTDRSGKPVSGLQQQDFTVLDNKMPQSIQSFRESGGAGGSAEPITKVLVVIDAINNYQGAVAFDQQQFASFLRAGMGDLPLPMSLVLVTDKYRDQIPFTRDRNILLQALKTQKTFQRVHVVSQATYGAQERTDASRQSMEELVSSEISQPGRKLLIWLGSGWAYLEGPGIHLTNKGTEAMFRHIVWMSTELRESRTVLYSLDQPQERPGFGDAFYYQSFMRGVDFAKNTQAGNGALQVVAAQSGGLVLNRSNDLADSIATCLTDASHYYTLAFDASPAGHPNEYHSLQVQIDRPKLTVRTRTGYYSQP